MRVFHGNISYTFDEVPLQVNGKPAWAGGTVWIKYKQVEGKDDGREWAETDYEIELFEKYSVFDEDGYDIPNSKDLEYEITEWIYSHRNDEILEKIEYDCHEFM